MLVRNERLKRRLEVVRATPAKRAKPDETREGCEALRQLMKTAPATPPNKGRFSVRQFMEAAPRSSADHDESTFSCESDDDFVARFFPPLQDARKTRCLRRCVRNEGQQTPKPCYPRRFFPSPVVESPAAVNRHVDVNAHCAPALELDDAELRAEVMNKSSQVRVQHCTVHID